MTPRARLLTSAAQALQAVEKSLGMAKSWPFAVPGLLEVTDHLSELDLRVPAIAVDPR